MDVVSTKVDQACRAGQSGGVLKQGGLLDFVKGELTDTASAVTDQAEEVLLQQELHRKLLACYPEDPVAWYLRLAHGIILQNLRVHARGLLKQEQRFNATVGELCLEICQLLPPDLVAHPKAVRQDALPVPEVNRRFQVMLSYRMRQANRRELLDLATAGVREQLAAPGWLLPKAQQGAVSYVADLSKGLGDTVGKIGQAAPGVATGMIKGAGKLLNSVPGKNAEITPPTDGVTGAVVETATVAGGVVSGVVTTTSAAAPQAVKGAGDLLGGMVGDAGAALTNVTGISHFTDVGNSAKNAVGAVGDTVGGALSGFFGAFDRPSTSSR